MYIFFLLLGRSSDLRRWEGEIFSKIVYTVLVTYDLESKFNKFNIFEWLKDQRSKKYI
jgi:hypothetical protein